MRTPDESTNILEESLLDDGKFDRIREHLRDEASGFGNTKRGKRLKALYWRAPQSMYHSLNVRWDFRRHANRLNLEASDDYLRTCGLYECDSAVLLSHLACSDNFSFERLFDVAEKYILLQVIGHWEKGTPLTPPVLNLRDDGQLGKLDGFHRLAVAFAIETPIIPFWAFLPHNLIGVRESANAYY